MTARFPRAYCATPDRCSAPKKGLCPCAPDAHKRHAAKVRAALASQEHRARLSRQGSASMAKLRSDPAFVERLASACSSALKRCHQDPEFKARAVANAHAAWWLPPMTDEQRRVYRKFQRFGLSRRAALTAAFMPERKGLQ